jgi:predicted transcriptional regulator
MLIFSAAKNPYITEDVNKINAWYNKNIDRLDSGIDVGYRQIFFISKRKDSIGSVKRVVDAIAKKEAGDYVTINRATIDEFATTLSRINKKYVDLFELFQKTTKTKKQLIDEIKLLTESLDAFQTHNAKLTAELSDIHASLSWKLSKPLRVVAKLRRILTKKQV